MEPWTPTRAVADEDEQDVDSADDLIPDSLQVPGGEDASSRNGLKSSGSSATHQPLMRCGAMSVARTPCSHPALPPSFWDQSSSKSTL